MAHNVLRGLLRNQSTDTSASYGKGEGRGAAVSSLWPASLLPSTRSEAVTGTLGGDGEASRFLASLHSLRPAPHYLSRRRLGEEADDEEEVDAAVLGYPAAAPPPAKRAKTSHVFTWQDSENEHEHGDKAVDGSANGHRDSQSRRSSSIDSAVFHRWPSVPPKVGAVQQSKRQEKSSQLTPRSKDLACTFENGHAVYILDEDDEVEEESKQELTRQTRPAAPPAPPPQAGGAMPKVARWRATPYERSPANFARHYSTPVTTKAAETPGTNTTIKQSTTPEIGALRSLPWTASHEAGLQTASQKTRVSLPLPPSPITPYDRQEVVRIPHSAQRGHQRNASSTASASALASAGAAEKNATCFGRFRTLTRRPYLSYQDRSMLETDRQMLRHLRTDLPVDVSVVVHLDFEEDEISCVLEMAQAAMGKVSSAKKTTAASSSTSPASSPAVTKLLRQLEKATRNMSDMMQRTVAARSSSVLSGRTVSDVLAFLADVAAYRWVRSTVATSASTGRALVLQRHGLPSAAKDKMSAAETRGPSRARETRDTRQTRQTKQTTRLSALLFARSMAGQVSSGGSAATVGRVRELLVSSMTNEVRRIREDNLQLRHTWTSCAGDISTVSWTSPDAFLCGTVTHMDQYNRQGNFVLGSVPAGTLQAYPDHRILRPKPATLPASSAGHGGHGGLDPWLYTSVVSSDYSATHGLAFTAGFDRVVRVWRVDPTGASMTPMAVWPHKGRVNFVVASGGGDEEANDDLLVATAADVPTSAVRIYRLKVGGVASRLDWTASSYSCSRIADGLHSGIDDPDHDPDRPQRPWGYLPAAVRWGLAASVRHLLLVGYSPRSMRPSADESDIPEERANSGELCLWDGRTGERWRIPSAGASQNVFEVAWHPSRAWFAAATSPAGNATETRSSVRTQVRIFEVSRDDHIVHELHVLDCLAEDINELALLPSSADHLFVAAGCTNHRTYVWDTSRGSLPVHTLVHGRFLEEKSGDVISIEDTGVKFVAWGATPDRLYTGASDGLVKVWNIRSQDPGQPFVRDLLECKASVSFGAFSPDKSRLVVGDASGCVFLLDVDKKGRDKKKEEDGQDDDGDEDDDDEGPLSEAEEDRKQTRPSQNQNQNQNPAGPWQAHMRMRRQPPAMIRHPTPPPEEREGGAAGDNNNNNNSNSLAEKSKGNDDDDDDDDSGCASARAFLRAGQLRIMADRTVGAVQGPRYAETGFFCRPCHLDSDPAKPLLAVYERDQLRNQPRASDAPFTGRALGNVWKMPWTERSWGYYHEDRDQRDQRDRREKDHGQAMRRRTLAAHRRSLARDLDLDALPSSTRRALLEADRGALRAAEYEFDYEEMPDLWSEDGDDVL